MLTVGCNTHREELSSLKHRILFHLKQLSSILALNSLLFILKSSLVPVPTAGGSSAQPIRPTCALRWSSRSSFAVRKELRPRRSIGRGRRRRSCTNRGRMSSCPGPSRKPGTTGIHSDKQRHPALAPWSISVELSLVANTVILNKYCSK